MIAAPTRFAIERRFASSSPSPVGYDADLQRALLELAQHVAEPPRHARQRIELRVEVREEAVRLEPPLRLDAASPRAPPPPSARSGRAPGGARARSRLPARASCRRARSSSAARCSWSSAIRCRSASDSPARMPDSGRQWKRGSLRRTSWTNAGWSDFTLVSESEMIRSATSSARFCAIASRSSDRPRRVSSSRRPSSPKSSSASRPSSVRRTLPACGSAW